MLLGRPSFSPAPRAVQALGTRLSQLADDIAELGDGEHSSADFIEKIQEVNYVFAHEEDFPLLFEVGKLLLIEFAKMSESVISLSNLKESVEPPKGSLITNREDIDLVERALPQPMIEND